MRAFVIYTFFKHSKMCNRKTILGDKKSQNFSILEMNAMIVC